MVRRTDPKDDEWQHVTDPKKRKAIQDRLAQRARRKRLREAREDEVCASHARPYKYCSCDAITHTPIRDVESALNALCIQDEDDVESIIESSLPTELESALEFSLPSSSSASSASSSTGSKSLLTIDFSLTPLSAISSSPSSFSSIDSQLSSQSHPAIEFQLSPQSQPQPPQTVFSALYINGTILGLSCSVCISSPSPAAAPHHPISLHPTEAQLLHVHPRWYDRLPFPKMRDSLIRSMGVVDEEELLRDLCTMPSWTIDSSVGWERSCWDTRAWKMEKEWRAKWGWLMV